MATSSSRASWWLHAIKAWTEATMMSVGEYRTSDERRCSGCVGDLSKVRQLIRWSTATGTQARA